MEPQLGLRSNNARAAQACARCRRQKLKCEENRPCLLCVRSGSVCEERVVIKPPAKRRRHEQPIDRLNSPSSRPRRANRARQNASVETDDTAVPASRSPDSITLQRQDGPPSQFSPKAVAEENVQPASNHSSQLREIQQFGANTSAVGFAMNLLGDDISNNSTSPTIPGDSGTVAQASQGWRLKTMKMPPEPVMEALIEAYFEGVHWFIFLFHKGSFQRRFRSLISRGRWSIRDGSYVVVSILVAALGLRCVMADQGWTGHELLQKHNLQPEKLLQDLIGEAKVHLMDMIEQNEVETVQACQLLGTYYIYHGSPNASWNLIGLSARSAYGLALHCESQEMRSVSAQVRRRCWNHITVSDTFASMIYGRPASIDSAFSDILPMQDLDDTSIPYPLNELGILNHGSKPITGLTFHQLKYQLYQIIRQALSSFRLLNLHNPISLQELKDLVEIMRRNEELLKVWREDLPAFFNWSNWGDDVHWPYTQLREKALDLECQRIAQDLALQATTLRITYYGARILISRPLLEHRLSVQLLPELMDVSLVSIPNALENAVMAALGISETPISMFTNHFSLSFVCMQFFIAGVILCTPCCNLPFTDFAQKAKAGVVRIIRACRTVRNVCRVAQHTEDLLSRLLRVMLSREMENALGHEEQGDTSNEQLGTPAAGYVDVATMVYKAYERHGPRIYLPGMENQLQNSQTRISPNEGSRSIESSTTSALGQTGGTCTLASNISHQQLDPESNSSQQNSIQPPFDSLYPIQHGDSIETQFDNVFGAFGELMFNLVPDDPYTAWSWGAQSR